MSTAKSTGQLPSLESSWFDWLHWIHGDPMRNFGVQCRGEFLIANADVLRRYAVGWCDGWRVPCRPKANKAAVMYLKDDRHFWFHLRQDEFDAIFCDGGNHE